MECINTVNAGKVQLLFPQSQNNQVSLQKITFHAEF